MRHMVLALGAALALAGCVGTVPPQGAPQAAVAPAPVGSVLPPEAATRTFVSVVAQVEPVAEAMCRARLRGRSCDFRIIIDDRPGQPKNAFQSLDGLNRPVLGFTSALIADARNPDELAFVVGHEAAHHIAGHIPQQQESAMTGAILAGILVAASGASPEDVRAAQEMGATLAARSYSKDFELEADALGTEIAFRAGFDPVRGSAYFDRLPDPGDQFLGTHPPNAQRKALIRRVAESLR